MTLVTQSKARHPTKQNTSKQARKDSEETDNNAMNQEQNVNCILSDMEWKQASESLENILACATRYLSNSRSDEDKDPKTNHGVTVEVLERNSSDLMNGVKVTVDPILLIGSESGLTAAQIESWTLQEDVKTKGDKIVSNLKSMRPTKAEIPTKAETPKKRFRCVKCNVLFGRKANLDQHYRIHTDERPYHCDHCSKTFRQKCHLDQHTKVHTGERPYECVLCNKAFKQKGQLYNHNKTAVHIQKAAEAACGNTEDVVVVMPSPE